MRKLLILSVLITLVGCGRDVTGPGVMGAYHLVTVNGSLPSTILQTATETDEVTGGTAAIGPDGTWYVSLYLRVTAGSSVTQPDSDSDGTWTQNGNTFTFRDSSNGSTSTATYNAGWLTVVKGAVTFVYLQDGSPSFCNRCL